MRLFEKRDSSWFPSYLQGRYKKQTILIKTQRSGKHYYSINGDITYNSLWNNDEFTTVEDASQAAQNHVDRING